MVLYGVLILCPMMIEIFQTLRKIAKICNLSITNGKVQTTTMRKLKMVKDKARVLTCMY